MTHRIATIALFFSLLSLILAGCDSSDGPDQDHSPGQGSAAVSGSISSNFSGMSIWTEFVDEETNEPYFAIMIFDGGSVAEMMLSEIVIIAANRTRPANGTHPLGDYDDENDEILGAIYMQPSSDGSTFTMAISLTGSLTLNHSSSSNTIEGSFNFQGPVMNQTGVPGGEAEVSGSFNATFFNLGVVPVAREMLTNHMDDIREALAN